MSNSDYVQFRCMQVNQPIGTFYIGVVKSQDLVDIAFADVRRLKARDVEELIGIQRPLSNARVGELQQYVNTIDASFPTGIILAIAGKDAEYNVKKGTMRVRRDEKVAKILDGQHRIAGLEEFRGQIFELNVTIFVDMDIEDQAMLFATINLKQTKVSKSLMYDLYEFAKTRSPQKTCHNIAKLLNNEKGSPFKDKIKILGAATGKPDETLTQAAFVDSMIGYLSPNPMSDRDQLRRGRKLRRISDDESQNLIFRNMFINGQDAKIAREISNFFTAVAKRWPEAWPYHRSGNILNRTNGLRALMRFHRDAYLKLSKPGGGDVVPTASFSKLLKQVSLSDEDFNPERYKPGTSGERALYRDFLEQSGLAEG